MPRVAYHLGHGAELGKAHTAAYKAGGKAGRRMRILFITYTRIGDAVLSSGLLGHLIERYPQARLTIVCGPAPAPLFKAIPNLERLIVLEKRRFDGHWLALWADTVGNLWDLVVDLRNSLVGRAVLARQRRLLKPSREPLHRVEQLARLFALDPPPPRLWLDDAARRRAMDLIPEIGPVLALGPTANSRRKEWPAERFAELARRLAGAGGALPGARIAVFGAAGERTGVLPLIEALGGSRLIDLVGTVDLATAAACLERANLYVGNDSGLMHMAAAVGTPTLGLFGPTREDIYAPWGPHTGWVRTERAYQDMIDDPAFPSGRGYSWMQSLGIDQVEAAARDVLRKVAMKPAGGRCR